MSTTATTKPAAATEPPTDSGIQGTTPIKDNSLDKMKESLSSSPLGIVNPLHVTFLGTLVAFVFIVLITFSTPISTSLYFLYTTQANGVRFGLWGWCLDEGLCSPLRLGYTWEPEVPIPITNAFVFYPATLIILVLTLISFIPVLGARDATADRVFRFFGWCAFASSLMGFVFMIGTWAAAKPRFEKAGFDARFGPLPWLSLAATIILFGVVFGSYYTFPPPPVRQTKGLSAKTSLATLRDVFKRFSRIGPGPREDIEKQLAVISAEKGDKDAVAAASDKPLAGPKVTFDRKEETKRREAARERKRASNQMTKPERRRTGQPSEMKNATVDTKENAPPSAEALAMTDRSENLKPRPTPPPKTVVTTTTSNGVSKSTRHGPTSERIRVDGAPVIATAPAVPLATKEDEPATPIRDTQNAKGAAAVTKSPSIGPSEQSDDFYSPPRVHVAVKAVNTTARMKRLHVPSQGGTRSHKSELEGTEPEKRKRKSLGVKSDVVEGGVVVVPDDTLGSGRR